MLSPTPLGGGGGRRGPGKTTVPHGSQNDGSRRDSGSLLILTLTGSPFFLIPGLSHLAFQRDTHFRLDSKAKETPFWETFYNRFRYSSTDQILGRAVFHTLMPTERRSILLEA